MKYLFKQYLVIIAIASLVGFGLAGCHEAGLDQFAVGGGDVLGEGDVTVEEPDQGGQVDIGISDTLSEAEVDEAVKQEEEAGDEIAEVDKELEETPVEDGGLGGEIEQEEGEKGILAIPFGALQFRHNFVLHNLLPEKVEGSSKEPLPVLPKDAVSKTIHDSITNFEKRLHALIEPATAQDRIECSQIDEGVDCPPPASSSVTPYYTNLWNQRRSLINDMDFRVLSYIYKHVFNDWPMYYLITWGLHTECTPGGDKIEDNRDCEYKRDYMATKLYPNCDRRDGRRPNTCNACEQGMVNDACGPNGFVRKYPKYRDIREVAKTSSGRYIFPRDRLRESTINAMIDIVEDAKIETAAHREYLKRVGDAIKYGVDNTVEQPSLRLYFREMYKELRGRKLEIVDPTKTLEENRTAGPDGKSVVSGSAFSCLNSPNKWGFSANDRAYRWEIARQALSVKLLGGFYAGTPFEQVEKAVDEFVDKYLETVDINCIKAQTDPTADGSTVYEWYVKKWRNFVRQWFNTVMSIAGKFEGVASPNAQAPGDQPGSTGTVMERVMVNPQIRLQAQPLQILPVQQPQ